ncbi:LANO_0G14840g1_1 [Lachancea nothofagi CBS 11611]|uniref:LANO_0G14840g1_1 n=1 Tax=Lachancea nothofagi CBS 11611 TaxID=1266666 RepID=A0A1G4KKK2_9SACH|nr:LANO_0G14840g1_1 [Lachancea nothofagi CBS 11611]
MRDSITDFINGQILVLDGGQGTDLEERGINVSHPLWSTLPYLTRDGAQLECIRDMYHSFIKAGSNALMTVTYQASYSSLKKFSDGQVNNDAEYASFLDYIIEFTEKECISDNQYLVGSIGPYAAYLSNGAEYTGDYGDKPIDFISHYRPQVTHFASSTRVDIIGIETIPNIAEFKALLSLEFAKMCSSKPYYISITTDKHGNLRDGTSAKNVCQSIKDNAASLPANFLFFGVNCIDFSYCGEILAKLNGELSECTARFRAAYPNSGEVYHGDTHSWSENPTVGPLDTWENLTSTLLQQHCLMIGGCCRTSSKDISSIATAARGTNKSV